MKKIALIIMAYLRIVFAFQVELKIRRIYFLIAVIIAFTITSCAHGPYYYSSLDYIDYNKYNKMYGIFITEANSVAFDYSSLGSINFIERSGHKKIYVKHFDDVYSLDTSIRIKPGDWIVASIDKLLYLACKETIKRGGNGIINLKIEYCPSSKEYSEGYKITGMVIKNK